VKKVKKIFKPLFILAFVCLPQILSLGYIPIIFGLSSIKSLAFPITILLIASAFFAAYAYKRRKEEAISTRLFISISAVYSISILYSILYGPEFSNLRNFTSPKLIFIAACVISIAYSILGIVYNTTSPGKTYDLVRYVIGIILVPLTWFLAINIASGVNSNAMALILIIASVYALVFFIAKLLFIGRLRLLPLSFDSKPNNKYYIAMFVITLCMPLCGLIINQAFSGFGSDIPSAGIFGDFSHPLFYIIAVLNGLLLLIPPLKNRMLRLFLFYLKSVGYTYILYFFAVFIPILPLGFLGIIVYGLGLLILTPLLAAALQGYHIVKEWSILSKSWSKLLITAVFCIGIITLPLCMAATSWNDKENLKLATQYLEPKDFNNNDAVNLNRLKRTLNNIKGGSQVTRGMFSFSGNNTPIISKLYNQLILDEKVLSFGNVLALENLFFDAGHDLKTEKLSNPDIVSNHVSLLDAISETKFDEKIGVYRTWVNLKLENASFEDNGEFITTFKLPEGAYISDYYLDVFGIRKPGLLTDRRAALFIYSKIVNTRRDPGLLHYVGENTIELRVFPFAANEVRETGFEVIHSQKFDLDLGFKTISLGGDNEQKEIKVSGAVLLPATQKTSLKPVVRKPKYHFVIDNSKNSDVPWHISQVLAYTKANHIEAADVTFASYKLQQHTLSDMTQTKHRPEGGFNLNMAVNMILSKEDTSMFPIIIAVSDNMPAAVLPRDVYSLAAKFPESLYYYTLNHNLTLTPYSYEDNRADYTETEPIISPILDYNGKYVLDNNKSELVLTDMNAAKPNFTGNQYEDAILLDVLGQKEQLIGEPDAIEMVRTSFRAKILTPQTAFIVVETQEQEEELLSLQERILNNKVSTPTVTLDEPPFIICLMISLILILTLKIKKTRSLLKGKFNELVKM
jgi:uncharacterized membrane protein